MGVSIYIEGLKDVTEEYTAKRDAYLSCKKAGIDIPEELLSYFANDEGEDPSDSGIVVPLYNHPSVEGEVYYGDGAVIDLSALPEGVTRIRVYAS